MSDELMKLLGAETIEEIRIGLRDLILQKFADDIEDEHTYWITYEDVEEMIRDVTDELKAEYKELLKDKIREKVEGMFSENN